MGLLLSVIISYAGVREALDCMNHIISGMIPEGDPDFRDLVDHYTRQLHKPSQDNPGPHDDWTKDCGQGYLCLTEDENGKLKSAAVKYYDGQPNSTAILFSTKISSFGQESVESTQSNGDARPERYSSTRTKTILTDTSESFSVGHRNRSTSPTSEHVSDSRYSESCFEGNDRAGSRSREDSSEKLKWHYRPKSPIPPTLPEIQFQSYDDAPGVNVSEEYLRSLDGIKFRPLQRSDPSGRRRSFKKRHSSSSTSSRESRASREEELKVFTSLEEAEFELAGRDQGFGSAPNLAARSYSRSRSRESSKERRNESWSAEPSVDLEDPCAEPKPLLKDLPKLDSFEEEKEKVTEEEDVDDFWGNSGD